MKIISVLFVFFLGACAWKTINNNTDEAETYKPGTIGYVYQSCQKSLVTEKTGSNFQKTYCGRFLSGLLTGVMSSNWIILTSKKDDPCQSELDKAHDHINSRSCSQLESSLGGQPNFLLFFDEWISYLEQSNLKEEAFAKPVTMAWRYMTKDRQFCNHVKEHGFSKEQKLSINPDLSKDFQTYKFYNEKALTWDDVYKGCTQDIQISNDTAEGFASTSCGSEILGYIAGMYSTKALQDRPKAEGICKKRIDDLYENLDITKRSCLNEDADILELGKLYVRVVDKLRLKNIKEGRKISENEKIAYGTVMSVVSQYYDLCHRQFRLGD